MIRIGRENYQENNSTLRFHAITKSPKLIIDSVDYELQQQRKVGPPTSEQDIPHLDWFKPKLQLLVKSEMENF